MNLKVAVGLLALALGISANAPSGSANSHGKIMGCYVGTWGYARPGYGAFDIDDIDPFLCTHGFYGFADLNNITNQVYIYDPWYDLADSDCAPGLCGLDSYRRFVALKEVNPDFHPILSVGGWTSGSERWSVMAADPESRKQFIDSLIPLLENFGFDGVDIDWEYPGNREGSDPENDKENFVTLIREIREALPEGMLLSSAVSPNYAWADIGYDIPALAEIFDFINIMTYDYNGWWEPYLTGHNCPLYSRKEERIEGEFLYKFNMYDSVMHYIERGMPLNKIVLGVPLYGRGFVLEDPIMGNGLHCPGIAGIRKGPYTRQAGTLGYLEVLQLFLNETLPNHPDATPKEWDVVRDTCSQSPYMVNGPYWFSYDDPESLTLKAHFINELGIAGAFAWSLDTDDFAGRYSDETYPLVRAVNRAMASGEKFDPTTLHDTCGSAPICGGTLSDKCKNDLEKLPHPDDCHRYIRCHERQDEGFNVEHLDCEDMVYNPNTRECVHPNLPGSAALCKDN